MSTFPEENSNLFKVTLCNDPYTILWIYKNFKIFQYRKVDRIKKKHFKCITRNS